MSTDGDALARAIELADRANLKIIPKRNAAGEVINYRLYRNTLPHLGFIKQCNSPLALLSAVENAGRRS